MNRDWQQFLTTLEARIDAEERVAFPVSDSSAGCRLVDLSHLSLISVSGNDSETFLQGQVTNDVRNVDKDRFQINALCTHKGRMLASFVVVRQPGGYLLQLPRATQQALLKRLPMFVLMSDVKISDASDEWVRFGLLGEDAEQVLGSQFAQIPTEPWQAVVAGEITLLRHPGQTARFELIGPPQPMIDAWQRLAASASPASIEQWSVARIRAGIPTVYGATSEAFLPQMTNMQLINGVSFTKGCYTGQEVVARTKYLGKIKRRMYLARTSSAAAPQPGDELFAGEHTAGKVVDAASSQEGGYELLAVIEIERQERDSIHLGGSDSAALQFHPLPYPFEQD